MCLCAGIHFATVGVMKLVELKIHIPLTFFRIGALKYGALKILTAWHFEEECTIDICSVQHLWVYFIAER